MPERRIQRSRSTRAVVSRDPSLRRWWEQPPAVELEPSVRHKQLHFHSGDPFDRFAVLRYVCVCLSLLVPVVILARSQFASRTVHHDWSGNPMQEVQRSLQNGQQHTALASLKAEAERSPQNPEILRALAALAAETSPADARRCYHKLNALGLTTDADCAGHAALLAKLHDFTGAKAVLSNISKAAQSMPQAQYAWLAIWREACDFAAAADTLEKLTASTPCDVEIALDLVRQAAAAKTEPEVLHRIESSLLKSLRHWMSTGRAQDVLSLAPQIAALPLSSPTYRTQMAQILRNLPGTPVQHRLAAVRFAFPNALSPADQQQLRIDNQNEIAWSGGISADEKDTAAAYLQSQGEHALITTLISAREALTEPKLFSRRFDSLLELGNWREAGAMTAALDAPALPNSRSLAHALATLQSRTKRTYAVEMLLTEALSDAQRQNRSLDCYATGCAALDNALPSLAATAFATALDISKDRAQTMQAIIRSSRQGRLALDTFLRSLVGSPAMQDETIQESLIYLSLLAGQKVDNMLAIVRNRRQLSPDNIYLRFLEALALHQLGNHSDAASLIIPLPQYRWHQGEAAVLASIIAAAGKIDRHSALIQQIDPTHLFPEERTLFDPWHSRLNLGPAPGLASSVGSE